MTHTSLPLLPRGELAFLKSYKFDRLPGTGGPLPAQLDHWFDHRIARSLRYVSGTPIEIDLFGTTTSVTPIFIINASAAIVDQIIVFDATLELCSSVMADAWNVMGSASLDCGALGTFSPMAVADLLLERTIDIDAARAQHVASYGFVGIALGDLHHESDGLQSSYKWVAPGRAGITDRSVIHLERNRLGVVVERGSPEGGIWPYLALATLCCHTRLIASILTDEAEAVVSIEPGTVPDWVVLRRTAEVQRDSVQLRKWTQGLNYLGHPVLVALFNTYSREAALGDIDLHNQSALLEGLDRFSTSLAGANSIRSQRRLNLLGAVFALAGLSLNIAAIFLYHGPDRPHWVQVASFALPLWLIAGLTSAVGLLRGKWRR